VEDLCDVESLYLLNFFVKSLGSSDIQAGNVLSKVNIDVPIFYGLNRTLKSFENINGLIMIGTNTRFEASLLNTLLRKQQLAKALPYVTFNHAASLKLKQNHQGSGVRSLLAFVDNKVSLTKTFYNMNNVSLILGAGSLKTLNGSSLQNIFRFLSKKFFTKIKNEERASILHSSITTLLFANVGIQPGVRSDLYNGVKDRKIHTLFAVQPFEFNKKK